MKLVTPARGTLELSADSQPALFSLSKVRFAQTPPTVWRTGISYPYFRDEHAASAFNGVVVHPRPPCGLGYILEGVRVLREGRAL
jgi:hypothetical protein